MADRYWVNDDADGDWDGTNNWSTSSGGAGGAATPTSSDAVIFDQAAAGDCALSANANCASLTMTVANGDNLDCVTHNLTVAGAADLDCAGGGETVTLGEGTIDIGGTLTVTGISLDCETADLTCGNVLLDGAGDFDFGSGDHEIADFTVTGSGDVDYGSATITTSGDFDNSAMTGVTTEGASTWVFIKSGGTIKLDADIGDNDGFHDWRVSGDTEVIAASATPSIQRNVLIDAGATLTVTPATYVSGDIINNGVIAGTSIYSRAGGGVTGGTMLLSLLLVGKGGSIGGFVTTGALEIEGSATGTVTISGDITCDNLRLDINAGETITLDLATNNASLTITGDVIDQVDGTLTWQAGAGVTLSGSGNQDVDFDGSDIGPLVINNTGGTVTLSGAVECDSLSVTDGTVDFNGQTITCGGDVTFATGTVLGDQGGATIDYAGDIDMRGVSGTQLAINNLDFVNDAGSTSHFRYCTVTDSERTGDGDDHYAPTTFGNVDGTGNTGWTFPDLSLGLPPSTTHTRTKRKRKRGYRTMTVESISVTTDASGDATVYSQARYTGRIIAITYDGSMDTGADLTITTNDTAQAVLTKANAGTSAVVYRPVQTLQDASDGSDLVAYDYIQMVDEKLKIVVAAGGNAQTGVFKLIVDED